jgi:predicted RNA polymerase sigma factor
MPSKEEIEAVRTPKGGWTKAQLAEWGVPWPPPRGWKKRLEAGEEPKYKTFAEGFAAKAQDEQLKFDLHAKVAKTMRGEKA